VQKKHFCYNIVTQPSATVFTYSSSAADTNGNQKMIYQTETSVQNLLTARTKSLLHTSLPKKVELPWNGQSGKPVLYFASRLIYCWCLLRNNNQATILKKFPSSYGSRRFAACGCWTQISLANNATRQWLLIRVAKSDFETLAFLTHLDFFENQRSQTNSGFFSRKDLTLAKHCLSCIFVTNLFWRGSTTMQGARIIAKVLLLP